MAGGYDQAPGAGLYWWSDDAVDVAHGLYPRADMAQLLPRLEHYGQDVFDCQLDNAAKFYGLWNFNPATVSGAYEGPIVDLLVPSTSSESVQFFDRVNRANQDFDPIAPGATVVRVDELTRYQVPEAFLGILEHIATDVQWNTNEGVVDPIGVRGVSGAQYSPGLPGSASISVVNEMCPYPLLSVGGGLQLSVSFVLQAIGVPATNDAEIAFIENGAERDILAGIPVGPGRWTDNRFGFGLPRYGAQQWQQRGPSFVQLLAVTRLTNLDPDTPAEGVSVRVAGRLSGYVQDGGGRRAALFNSQRRTP